MSKLLEYSADVNICNNEGLTAVSAEFLSEILEILLKNNIKSNSNAKCSTNISVVISL